MKKKALSLLAGLMAAGAVGATATSASAYIVCNADGDCWHTHNAWVARPGWVRHEDDWYFHRGWTGDPRYHWHDWRDGHGYWRGGVWVNVP